MTSHLRYVDTLKRSLVRYCSDLIETPTVNPPGEGYGKLCSYLVEMVRTMGCEAELVRVPEGRAQELYPQGTEHPRIAVVGKYLNSEGERAGLHLNGHIDVVPPGKGWLRDPFRASEENGKLYGLGATDMKSGVACALGVLQTLSALHIKLKGDLTFSFAPDEETGGHAGVGYLAGNGFIRADYAIVLEPSQPHQVKIGHRGVMWLDVVTKGRTAHGSVPHRGVNAFDKMVSVAMRMKELEKQIKTKKTSFPTVDEQDAHPTLMMGGVVRCGVKTNVVPDECTASLDRRLIPEETLDEAYREIEGAVEELRKEDAELQVELRRQMAFGAASVPQDSPVCKVVAASHQRVTGVDPRIVLAAGFTDAHYLTEGLGIPTITYGPGLSGMAHVPDEYVLVDDLVLCTKVLADAAINLLA